MKPIKLIVRTKSETYPIVIGSNLIKNLSVYFKKNSISFNQCLLVIDKNVPNKMISILQNHYLRVKFLSFYLLLMKKVRIKKV